MPKSDHSKKSGRKSANIHDKFFKGYYQNPANLNTLMRAVCPKELYDIIDWSSLRLESNLLVVPGFNQRETDLVFSADLRDSDCKAHVMLMFEHKSFLDRNLVKQLARDQFLLYLNNDFESLVVPIVVLQDESGRSESIQFSDLFRNVSTEQLEVLMEYSVNFRGLLIDVHELDRQGLVKETTIDIAIRAMSIVRNFDASMWQDLLDRIWYVAEEDRKSVLQMVMGYICDYNDQITPEEILRLDTKTLEEREMVNSAVDLFRQEGWIEGLEEGRREIASHLLQKGMAPSEVVEVTKLSRDQVESLQQEMNDASRQ